MHTRPYSQHKTLRFFNQGAIKKRAFQFQIAGTFAHVQNPLFQLISV